MCGGGSWGGGGGGGRGRGMVIGYLISTALLGI